MNPAHPLPAVSHAASHADLERREHAAERASFGAQHNSGPKMRGANVGLYSRSGRFFPLLANLSEKSRARRTFFTQQFIAAITVVANRGPGHENLGLLCGVRESLR